MSKFLRHVSVVSRHKIVPGFSDILSVKKTLLKSQDTWIFYKIQTVNTFA